MAMPEVGLPNEPVPQTVTPRAFAASVSIEALRRPGGDQELQVGQGIDDPLREAGSFAHGNDDLEALQRRNDLVRAAEMFVEDLEFDIALDLRPVGDLENDVLVIVENCAANRHDASTLCFPGWF